ncbi:MAG: class I SAM-dependent methyltransferase [Candidatus Aenigmarchaeota archaeon]|nr:class I SAM-dependent methyltransferase [Candidatus Aenigmarchaeota archaeon]
MPIRSLPFRDVENQLGRSAGFLVPPHRSLKDGSLVSEKECEILARLVRMTEPATLFEFGTFEGFSTLILAMNAPKDARIYTLDLPRQIGKTRYPIDRKNMKYIFSRQATAFKNPYAKMISCLRGDSAAFDARPFRRQMDFIFIDGCHTYAYARTDATKAFSMLRPKGTIVWHDYNPRIWPEQVKFLRELSRKKELVHIRGTFFLLHRGQSD